MGRIGPEVLGRLFDAHAAALALYARQWCDGPEADDLVQDAFLALARQQAVPDQAAAWLHRVVRNAALTAGRRTRRRQSREEQAGRARAGPWFSKVDDQLDARVAASHLSALDPDCREAIVARLWGELTFEQIAELQGCGLTTAHRRYRTGLARLLERLERSCPQTKAT
ncbi:MAG: RNA polymerase sigma factor [Paludisphaera borealis]|uniref:RNA polymerase sigma factor n=1 Tax=Paludisphaera borealis TaxID=1387353 RepID=UPI00284E47B1|nr:RNA polymerase sigma factor [Paludisphaera borealis]MDR3619522.1 RNA polymerase sigma factor [Paludisphaera borealis]